MHTDDRKSQRSVFAWDDKFALGHGPMDESHREFVDCVDALLGVEDYLLPAALERFEDHARRHFAEEDQVMRETAYDSAGCHIEEHAAVLESLVAVRELLKNGRCDVVRSFANALVSWFPEHVSVMDQGLARWVISRQYNGSPIRFQKRVATAINSFF